MDILQEHPMLYWLIALALALLLILLSRFVVSFLFRLAEFILARFFQKNYLRSTYQSLRKPATILVITLGIAAILTLLPLPMPEWLASFLWRVLNSVGILAFFHLLYNVVRDFVGVIDQSVVNSDATKKTAWNYLSGALRALIVIVGFVLVLAQWIENISGLIAGLGIGGIALALAAQDTASNLFAGVAIMLDSPFDIGDFIETETSTGDVSGSVEEIGLRSSKIRSASGALISVPNSAMGSAVIVNGTKRDFRLAITDIPLAQSTDPKILERLDQGLREIVQNDAGVTNKENIKINLLSFQREAMVWQLRYETVPDFTVHLETQHRVNLAVLDLMKELNLELAPVI